jgi:hypothetical protein
MNSKEDRENGSRAFSVLVRFARERGIIKAEKGGKDVEKA